MTFPPKSAMVAAALALISALVQANPAHAAERILLANGFDLLCNRHALVDGRVRVYLKANEPDYFELSPEAVTGYEQVPDPVAETTESDPPVPRQLPVQAPEARLTPADLHQLLARAGAEHHVDEDLLASVVQAESNGDARAVSRAGARGLMQLMPGTARQLGVQNSFAPDQNVRGGTAYLDALLTRYHDNIALALAAYNAGPEAVDRYRGIPPFRETRLYVARVVHEFNRRVLARRQDNSAGPETAANATGSGGFAAVRRD